MIYKEKNSIKWLEFELLQGIPDLIHGVFLRHGGRSKGPFSSLNVGMQVGDDSSAVEQNRLLICQLTGFRTLIMGNQKHTDQIVEISQSGLINPPICDGLCTHLPGLALTVQHADCQAAIFVDPVRNILANIHAGWRGNVLNIYQKTIDKLNDSFGCKAQDLLVAISPSLGPQAAEFKNFETEFPSHFAPFRRKECYFDLWACARRQLQEAGILEEHIQIAEICTYTHPEDYFSYRRDKVCGRHATVVGFR